MFCDRKTKQMKKIIDKKKKEKLSRYAKWLNYGWHLHCNFNVNNEVNLTKILIWILQGSGRMGEAVYVVGVKEGWLLIFPQANWRSILTTERSRRSKRSTVSAPSYITLHLGLSDVSRCHFSWLPLVALFQAILCIPLLRHHHNFLFTLLHTHEIVSSLGGRTVFFILLVWQKVWVNKQYYIALRKQNYKVLAKLREIYNIY